MADTKPIFIGLGRNIRGGNKYATVEIEGQRVRVILDPRKFLEGTVQAIAAEVERRIRGITALPAPATTRKFIAPGVRRGHAPLFNVTGKLRNTSVKFTGKGWAVAVGRRIADPVLNKLVATAKLSLAAISKAPAVKKAIEDDIPRSMLEVVGPVPKRRGGVGTGAGTRRSTRRRRKR